MAAIEPLCLLIGIDTKKLLKKESILLEADIFYNICIELKKYFKEQHKEYFNLTKFTFEMEDFMLEENFIRFIINDILSTNEYTLEGLAHYVGTHEDVFYEIMLGLNTNPSALCLRKIIELHRTARAELYNDIFSKIVKKNLLNS